MSVFIAICVLALDFLFYVLFQWTYGDKRRAMMKKVAEPRRALEAQERRPFVVKHGAETQARIRKVRARMGLRVA
jgi:hypothetical protein